MDRRKKLVTAGAISATATAGLIAVAASVGVFGLSDNPPSVGKLSPIDATRPVSSIPRDDVQTIIVDDPASTGGTATQGTSPGTTPGTAPRATSPTSPTTTVTTPGFDDHGDDRFESEDDSSGSGSHDDAVDNSGPGSEHSGRDHDEDD